MARAAVVLCPARWDEPFGMVAAEAQACGTPVVAFDRGALGEVIVNERTGFLVAPDDNDAAADAVKQGVGTVAYGMPRACRTPAGSRAEARGS
jgi:glycosyltransferase involved in cell wall biosynthesis